MMKIDPRNWRKEAEHVAEGFAVCDATKRALRDALERDPVDAFWDLSYVVDILKARMMEAELTK